MGRAQPSFSEFGTAVPGYCGGRENVGSYELSYAPVSAFFTFYKVVGNFDPIAYDDAVLPWIGDESDKLGTIQEFDVISNVLRSRIWYAISVLM